MSAQILVIEDELISQHILMRLLQQAGHEVVATDSGGQAWLCLTDPGHCFDVILLDRNLPDINGIELLTRIRNDNRLKDIPVIMQTAMAEPEDMLSGLRSGAYYYITKPFEPASLLAVVDSAVRHIRNHRFLLDEIKNTTRVLNQMTKAEFHFQTLDQARSIATLLCTAWPDGAKVVLGLSELMLNAIEHGNLGIDYQQKSRLLESGLLWEELDRRMAHPDFSAKQASVRFERTADEIRFLIRDQGPGFDWRHYLNMSPERALHTHGRGIAMAKMLSFDELQYQDPGNEVLAICRLSKS